MEQSIIIIMVEKCVVQFHSSCFICLVHAYTVLLMIDHWLLFLAISFEHSPPVNWLNFRLLESLMAPV